MRKIPTGERPNDANELTYFKAAITLNGKLVYESIPQPCGHSSTDVFFALSCRKFSGCTDSGLVLPDSDERTVQQRISWYALPCCDFFRTNGVLEPGIDSPLRLFIFHGVDVNSRSVSVEPPCRQRQGFFFNTATVGTVP